MSADIELLFNNKHLPYLDYALALDCLRGETEHTDDSLLFLSYLSAAIRKGHLCVEITESDLRPPLRILLDDVDQELETKLPFLTEVILKGACSLKHPLLVQDHNRRYFSRQWNLETALLDRLHLLLNTPVALETDSAKSREMLQEYDSQLLPEQVDAVRHAIDHPVTLITGGPGTGKTFTAARILQVLLKTLPGDVEIALAAPTGKAAANLQNSIASLLDGDLPKAQTLHRLLKRGCDLSADILLIDESSMIDAAMMLKLLKAVKPGSRLIMLGDPYQLPPVEIGGIFGDMTRCIPPVELKVCRRAELKEIVTLAGEIKSGNERAALEFLSDKKWMKSMGTPQELVQGYMQRYRDLFDSTKTPEELLKCYNSFCILTPLRKGPWGTVALNALFCKQLQGMNNTAPIMIMANDADMGLFNGEVGLLFRSSDDNGAFQEGDYALFAGPEGMRRFPAITLPAFEYAYCLSVHKSQGSEFGEVVLLMPEGSESFGREILYTGITRASRGVTIFSTEETLSKTIQQPSLRLSGVVPRFGV